MLLGVTYSEFDNIVGPRLIFSYPENILSPEQFETLSDYCIVGKHLCGKVITVKTEELQYINNPVAIDDAKYERNSLLFSFGFVLELNAQKEPYEPVLRKISSVFLTLETESEFLFQDATKSKIQVILQLIYEQLVNEQEVHLEIDDSNFLAIKLFSNPQNSVVINDHDVPILRYSKAFLSTLTWDLSLRHLLAWIDNISYVKKIAFRKDYSDDPNEIDMGMDIDCIKRGLRTLHFYNCVVISDILQFTNVYYIDKNTPARLFEKRFGATAGDNDPDNDNNNNNNSGNFDSNSTSNQNTCLRDQNELIDEIQLFCASDAINLPNANNIVDFILSFRPGVTLKEVIASTGGDDFLDGIDIRYLLAICQEKKLLYRMHEYPVYNASKDSNNKCYGIVDDDTSMFESVIKILDGTHCLDAICYTRHNYVHIFPIYTEE